MSELEVPVANALRGQGCRAEDLIALFNGLFQHSENTRIEAGDGEPVYLPADGQCDYHRVVFAHGYCPSVLHEVAHWCIAGEQRRRQVDYGYWYAPDGRSQQQQQAFERVEIAPQALEWIFSQACGLRFVVSADNLSGESSDSALFKQALFTRVLELCQRGLPVRAQRFRQQLATFYQRPDSFCAEQFSLSELSL